MSDGGGGGNAGFWRGEQGAPGGEGNGGRARPGNATGWPLAPLPLVAPPANDGTAVTMPGGFIADRDALALVSVNMLLASRVDVEVGVPEVAWGPSLRIVFNVDIVRLERLSEGADNSYPDEGAGEPASGLLLSAGRCRDSSWDGGGPDGGGGRLNTCGMPCGCT